MLKNSKKKYKGKAVFSLKTIIIIFISICTLSIILHITLNKKIKISQDNQIIDAIKVGEYTRIIENDKVTTRSSDSIDRTNIIENQNTENAQEETNIENNIEQDVETQEQEINEVQDEVAIEETKYISIQDVTISKAMDLTIRTGLSKEDFKKLISGVKQDTTKFFYNNSDTIYDVCEKYQINEVFFCGLISAESGWNIAGNHRRTYNYISLMSNGSLIKFDSVESGLDAAASKLHYNYLTPGGKFYHGKTLQGVKKRFCPASLTWTDLVYGRMKQIVK